jgi:hypothetical protein
MPGLGRFSGLHAALVGDEGRVALLNIPVSAFLGRQYGCCTGVGDRPRKKSEPQRALRLTMTEPEVVQIAPVRHRQPVDLLANMVVDYAERDHPERHHD